MIGTAALRRSARSDRAPSESLGDHPRRNNCVHRPKPMHPKPSGPCRQLYSLEPPWVSAFVHRDMALAGPRAPCQCDRSRRPGRWRSPPARNDGHLAGAGLRVVVAAAGAVVPEASVAHLGVVVDVGLDAPGDLAPV